MRGCEFGNGIRLSVMYPFSDYLEALRSGAEVKIVCTAVATVLLSAVNFLDEAVICLFLLMMIDFMLGFCRGMRENCISSEKLKRGALKFFWYGATLAAGMLFDYAICARSNVVANFVPFRATDVLILYLLLTEMISVLENVAALGVKVPTGLLEKLDSKKNKFK
jgi:phage-related holin